MKTNHFLIKSCFLLFTLLAAEYCQATEEYPIAHFFKRPDIRNIQVAPDGQHVSAVIVRDENKLAAILNVSNPLKPKIVMTFTAPKHEFVSSAFWANSNRLVFTTEERQTSLTSPRRTGKIYAGNIDGSNKKQIAGSGKNTNNVFVVGLLDIAKENDDEIIVATARRGQARMRVDWLNVNTGKTKLIATSPFMTGTSFVIDHDRQVRFASSQIEDTTIQTIQYRTNNDAEWQEFKHPFKGDISIQGFDGSNRYAYIISNDQTQFGLYKYDTQEHKFTQMLTDDTSTIDSIMWDNDGRKLLAARFHVGSPHYKFVDSDHYKSQLQQHLSTLFPDSFVSITSMSDDMSRAGVFINSDTNPGSLFLWDKASNRLIPLGPSLPQIDPKTMSKQKAIVVTARDGLNLHGYLTYRPDLGLEKRPMIVVVHGGPHGPYDTWGWNPETQLFANRGYLVLQINYRGSGGFGEQFEKSGYKKWGTEMQDDITDATHWAIKQGYADPDKVCIYGASYGGYATLAGVTREPDLYKCGFAFVGVYDLELMFKSGDIHRRKSGLYFLREALGTDEADLKNRSPINHVEKIKTPLFIAHGKKDDRADIKHYYELTKALDKANIKYETLLTDKEAHGFYDLSNNEELYGKMLDFFDKHIGKNKSH
jgi:dipeptidyl aminopeptidase/acylaminoacyl peptidase